MRPLWWDWSCPESSRCPAMRGGQGSSPLHLSEIWKVDMKNECWKSKIQFSSRERLCTASFSVLLESQNWPWTVIIQSANRTNHNIQYKVKRRGRNRSLAVSIWAVGKPVLVGPGVSKSRQGPPAHGLCRISGVPMQRGWGTSRKPPPESVCALSGSK